MTRTKVVICPYCGETQAEAERCRACGGLFEPLSRQATHNAMGPWFLRDPGKPFQPGCSYETLVKMIDRGQVDKYSIIRGPTTRQFWTVAKHVPGVAHLLGYCHHCDASVEPGDHGCHVCGVPFGAYLDRNYLGLPDVRPLPWEDEAGAGGPESGVPRSYELPDTAAGGRISRFARDEELLEAGHDAAPAGRPAAGAGEREAAGAGDVGSSVFEELNSPAVTSLRRRLAGQQRTIRILAALLVASLALLIVTNVGIIMTRGDGPTAATKPVEPTPQARAQNPPPPPPEIQEAPGIEADVAAAPQPADGQPAEAQDDTLDPADADDPADAARREYDAALELLAAADDASRSLDERIADCARAVETLQALSESVEPAVLPGLLEQLEQATRELERLRLKKFFG